MDSIGSILTSVGSLVVAVGTLVVLLRTGGLIDALGAALGAKKNRSEEQEN